jgi:CRISPR/Cas system-associated protein Csm6
MGAREGNSIFVMTVGLSLIENYVEDKIKEELNKDNLCIESFRKWWNIKEKKNNIRNVKDLRKELEDFVSKKGSKACAELSQLEGFIKNSKLEIPEKIFLIVTKSNKRIGSKFIGEILKEKIPDVLENSLKERIELLKEIADPFEGDEAFLKSIDEVVERVKEVFKNFKNERIYLFISGGYKGFIPILSVVSTIHKNIYIVYTHEESEEIFILPPLPFTIDFRIMDEYRSILRLQKKTIDKKLYNLIKSNFPSIEIFYSEKKDFERTNFGEWFKEIVEEGRFSFGENLRFKIKKKELREKLEKKLRYYEYLWIGDQIPETVEHSRYHSLRLCEYANLILTFYPDLLNDLGDEGLFILYVSIWLHDIGHGAIKFSGKKDGIFRKILKNDGLFDEIPENVALHPDKVRDYHNYLSVDMLENEFKFLLCNVENKLKDAIKLCIIYHRRKTPFLKDSTNQKNTDDSDAKFIYSLEEIIEREKDFTDIEKQLLLSSALLSFIDGLDVQSDRVVGKEYRKMREERDKYEVNYHLDIFNKLSKLHPEELNKVVEKITELKNKWEKCEEVEMKEIMKELSLNNKDLLQVIKYHAKRACFIMEQKKHFNKHSLIDTVLLGKEDDSKTLKISLVLNVDKVNPDDKKVEEIVKKICQDIREEFERTKKYLEHYFKLKEEFTKIIIKDGKEEVIDGICEF